MSRADDAVTAVTHRGLIFILLGNGQFVHRRKIFILIDGRIFLFS